MITKDLAKTISNAAIRAARQKEYETKARALVDTSTLLYIAMFGSENMERMRELPAGWTDLRNDFGVRFGGQRRTLHFVTNGIPPFSMEYGSPMRMPHIHIRDDAQNAPVAHGQAFADAYDAYVAFKDEISKLREKTEATIRGFTNLKVLAEQWPEMKPYIPAGLPVSKSYRALFNPASLNAQIGLPPT